MDSFSLQFPQHSGNFSHKRSKKGNQKFSKVFLICFCLSFLLQCSNARVIKEPHFGPVRKCGKNTENFLHFLCPKEKILYPVSENRIRLYQRHALRPSRKNNAFEYYAVTCCQTVCKIKVFEWMCEFNESMTACLATLNPKDTDKQATCQNTVIKEIGFPI